MAGTAPKRNIIVFLADDMSESLLRYMPNTRRLIFARGARFTNFYTNISLCCPSRATLLTGSYAHNTGIHGNLHPDGFSGFHVGPERRHTVAINLRRDPSFHTGLLGKYLNEYPFVSSHPVAGVRPTFIPPGWSSWAVPVRGEFAGVDYDLNLNGRLIHKRAPRDYLGDFLTRRALRLIEGDADRRGLALLLSYYGPHAPEPASPVEKHNEALLDRISRINIPRTPDFNERDVSDKSSRIRALPRMKRHVVRRLDEIYRRQVLSVSSIDRYVRLVVRKLRSTGQLRRTYLVFTSDNGLHMGSHRMVNGKNSPYEVDVQVPFAIRGPGIEPGTVVGEVTGNIDIAPTLADMAGRELHFGHDGESLLPLARGGEPPWRRYFLVERGRPFGGSNPERSGEFTRRIEIWSSLRAGRTHYRAVMSRHWQYVRYAGGEEELYDGRQDPYQVRNVLARPAEERSEDEKRALDDHRRALSLLKDCLGTEACRVQ